MARKRQRTKRGWTPEKILELWKKSSKKGLKRKKFAPGVFKEFEPALRKHIKEHLASHEFGSADEKNTKRVARDIGTICALLTKGDTVKKDSFQAVFELAQSQHEACLGGGGGGPWCDIG